MNRAFQFWMGGSPCYHRADESVVSVRCSVLPNQRIVRLSMEKGELSIAKKVITSKRRSQRA